MTTDAPIDRLELANAHGLFAIRSTSATVYYYSADTHELLRAPGDHNLSGTGPYDNCWNHLDAVSSEQDTGVITVGRRHRWDLDPNPGQPGMTIWWIQRTVTSIERIPNSDRPVGRSPEPNEDSFPFTLHPSGTANSTYRVHQSSGSPDAKSS